MQSNFSPATSTTSSPQFSGKRLNKAIASLAAITTLGVGASACVQTDRTIGSSGQDANVEVVSDTIDIGRSISCKKLQVNPTSKALSCSDANGLELEVYPSPASTETPTKEVVSRTDWTKISSDFTSGAVKCTNLTWGQDEFVVCDSSSGMEIGYTGQKAPE